MKSLHPHKDVSIPILNGMLGEDFSERIFRQRFEAMHIIGERKSRPDKANLKILSQQAVLPVPGQQGGPRS